MQTIVLETIQGTLSALTEKPGTTGSANTKYSATIDGRTFDLISNKPLVVGNTVKVSLVKGWSMFKLDDILEGPVAQTVAAPVYATTTTAAPVYAEVSNSMQSPPPPQAPVYQAPVYQAPIAEAPVQAPLQQSTQVYQPTTSTNKKEVEGIVTITAAPKVSGSWLIYENSVSIDGRLFPTVGLSTKNGKNASDIVSGMKVVVASGKKEDFFYFSPKTWGEFPKKEYTKGGGKNWAAQDEYWSKKYDYEVADRDPNIRVQEWSNIICKLIEGSPEQSLPLAQKVGLLQNTVAQCVAFAKTVK